MKFLEAENMGRILALQVVLGFTIRNPGGDIKSIILNHIAAHGTPEPLASKFLVIEEREAFLNGYRSTLDSFVHIL